MFDSYLVTPRPNVHVHNHVEQKPHDPADAARLYGQLEQRATEAVASATVERLGARNELTVVKIDSHRSYQTYATHVRLLFKVNGELYDIVAEANSWREKVARVLAEALVTSAMRSLLGKNGEIR